MTIQRDDERVSKCDDCGADGARTRRIPVDSDGGFGSEEYGSDDRIRELCDQCATEIGLGER